MKKLLLLFCLFNTRYSNAQERDTCYVGIYLKAIYDLSPSDFSFGADFYIWNNSADSQSLFKKLEITNAKKFEVYSEFSEPDDRRFVSYVNCKAQLTHDWRLASYPFDKQRLIINVEAQENINFIYLLQDLTAFQLDKGIAIPGWEISNYYVIDTLVFYPSTFGFRKIPIQSVEFNRLSFIVEIKRESWGVYFKLFMGLFIAFLVSYLSFFIKPTHLDPRFGVSIGALFASVANKYVVDSNIPATIGFSFVDMVHLGNFFFILAMLVLSAFSLKLFTRGKTDKSRLLDRKSAIIILASYIVYNTVLILIAAY